MRIGAIAVVVLFASSACANGGVLTYMLLPGSTITPVSGATPTGPAEPLSGTFEWQTPPVDDANIYVFHAVSLNFSSPSITIQLNQTALNDLDTSVFKSSSKTFFGEIVDLTGLAISLGSISADQVGSYTGSALQPELVIYQDCSIVPRNGGLFAAQLSFSAQLVPEPSAFAMLALGGIFLIGARRRVT